MTISAGSPKILTKQQKQSVAHWITWRMIHGTSQNLWGRVATCVICMHFISRKQYRLWSPPPNSSPQNRVGKGRRRENTGLNKFNSAGVTIQRKTRYRKEKLRKMHVLHLNKNEFVVKCMLHLNSTSRPYLGKTEYAFLTNAHHRHRTPWPLFCKDDWLLWGSSRKLPVRSSAWRDLMPDMQPCCSYARHRTTWQCWERAGWRKGQQGCATEYGVSVFWIRIEDQWRKFVKQCARVRKWHNLQPESSVFSPLQKSFKASL